MVLYLLWPTLECEPACTVRGPSSVRDVGGSEEHVVSCRDHQRASAPLLHCALQMLTFGVCLLLLSQSSVPLTILQHASILASPPSPPSFLVVLIHEKQTVLCSQLLKMFPLFLTYPKLFHLPRSYRFPGALCSLFLTFSFPLLSLWVDAGYSPSLLEE